MHKNTIISIIISIAVIGGAVSFFSVGSLRSGGDSGNLQNIVIRDGVQFVTIIAKGGYTPYITEVKSGLPTKLVVKTNDTYDCSASLVVRSANFQKILKPTGEEVIDLGILKTGDKIQGVCSMGMYSFQIKAS